MSYTGRLANTKLRAAVERRSLDVAKAYYMDELGGTEYEEVGKPYDIRVTVQGTARRCEVKGSSMEIDTVELTVNEVEHGTAFTPIDLIVVDNIVPTTDPDTGEVTGATGGRRKVLGLTGRRASRILRPLHIGERSDQEITTSASARVTTVPGMTR